MYLYVYLYECILWLYVLIPSCNLRILYFLNGGFHSLPLSTDFLGKTSLLVTIAVFSFPIQCHSVTLSCFQSLALRTFFSSSVFFSRQCWCFFYTIHIYKLFFGLPSFPTKKAEIYFPTFYLVDWWKKKEHHFSVLSVDDLVMSTATDQLVLTQRNLLESLESFVLGVDK